MTPEFYIYRRTRKKTDQWYRDQHDTRVLRKMQNCSTHGSKLPSPQAPAHKRPWLSPRFRATPQDRGTGSTRDCSGTPALALEPMRTWIFDQIMRVNAVFDRPCRAASCTTSQCELLWLAECECMIGMGKLCNALDISCLRRLQLR